MVTATCNHDAPVPIYPEGLAFVLPFLESRGAFVSNQDLAPTVSIRDLNRRVGGLVLRIGLAFACGADSEAAAKLDADAAHLLPSEGCWDGSLMQHVRQVPLARLC